MEKKGWKITAIIFICLFIVSTTFFVWVASIGMKAINTETKCRANICGNNPAYDSFYYDSNEGVCYCYSQGQAVYQEYIGG